MVFVIVKAVEVFLLQQTAVVPGPLLKCSIDAVYITN